MGNCCLRPTPEPQSSVYRFQQSGPASNSFCPHCELQTLNDPGGNRDKGQTHVVATTNQQQASIASLRSVAGQVARNVKKEDFYIRNITVTQSTDNSSGYIKQRSEVVADITNTRLPAYLMARRMQDALNSIAKDETAQGLCSQGWLNVPWQLQEQRMVPRVTGTDLGVITAFEASDTPDLIDTTWRDYIHGVHRTPITMPSEPDIYGMELARPHLESLVSALKLTVEIQRPLALQAQVDGAELARIIRNNRQTLEQNSLSELLDRLSATQVYVLRGPSGPEHITAYGTWLKGILSCHDVEQDVVLVTSQYGKERQDLVLRKYVWESRDGIMCLAPALFYMNVPYWGLVRCGGSAGIIIGNSARYCHTCTGQKTRPMKDLCMLGTFQRKFQFVNFENNIPGVTPLPGSLPYWYPYVCGGDLRGTSVDEPTEDTRNRFMLATIPEMLALVLAHNTTLLTTKFQMKAVWANPCIIDGRTVVGVADVGKSGAQIPNLTSGGPVVVSVVFHPHQQWNDLCFLWRGLDFT